MGSALKFLLYSIVFVLAWVLLTLLLTAQLTYSGSTWTSSLAASIRQLLPWMFVSPIIVLSSLWFPILHDRWSLNALLHLSLCMIILLAVSKIRETITTNWSNPVIATTNTQSKLSQQQDEKANNEPPPSTDQHTPPSTKKKNQSNHQPIQPQTTKHKLIHSIAQTAPLGIPLYISILLVSSLSHYRQEIHSRDQAALRLETQLTQTQLNLLRSQLQPHFLFNTLNSISCLIYSDPDKADSMVLQLSDLLRSTLDQRDATFISLKQEVETVQSYLNIQSTRFEDRIVIKTSIAPGTLAVDVPPMILLPLAENAVRYGVEKSTTPTTILIESRTEPNKLILSITDDGPGIDETETGGTGVGLTNTTNRLLTLYPEGTTQVTLIENSDGFTIATIELPLVT